ncbi:hypothetical protein I5M27_07290 [Adhaeribacter sp. BT258]|uniref:DUF5666 domain-containing protein n=1 Tax=Adhaeribacter terrigena TaxID=2793070 RepID=A0ABS1C2J3_9BACT|nr:hypothetical protein [Adhaeribacter terrigena]MBK0402785.1 hypothetical protein [Adhaeribacter terrigena]
MRILKLLPVVLLLSTACSQPTKKPVSSGQETPSEVPNEPVINSITGVVTEIQPGKDGYTAQVKTTEQETVFVTVSRVNLKDPESYRSVKIGDTLRAIGESWEMNGENHLKALELK